MFFLSHSLALLILASYFILHTNVSASHLPSPSGFVNDFVGVLSSEQKTSLESRLSQYEKETSNEISIALVKSLDGGEIDDFTVRAFEEWKVGKDDKDNGILILAAIEDRKVRIEVGYGLEGYLTDSQAGDIIRKAIAPEFAQGSYYQGLQKSIDQIQFYISSSGGEQERPLKELSDSYKQNIKPWASVLAVGIILYYVLVWILGKILPKSVLKWEFFRVILGTKVILYSALFLAVLTILAAPLEILSITGPIVAEVLVVALFSGVIYFFAYLGRTESFWLGGVVGLILGGIIGALFSLLMVGILSAILGGLGLLLDFLLSRVYKYRKSHHSPTDWWHSGGGFFGGGSGGGFGGFGGGGSGGGGASGDW